MSKPKLSKGLFRTPVQWRIRSLAARGAFAAAATLAGTLSCTPVQAEDTQGARYQILTLQSADLYLPALVLLDQATLARHHGQHEGRRSVVRAVAGGIPAL